MPGRCCRGDAVQSVPHVPTDVTAIGCDFLACSPYKFFGPHQGVLWGRAEAWERLEAYKVRPAGNDGAGETYTATGGKYYIGNGNEAAMVSVFGRVDGIEGADGYAFFATRVIGYDAKRGISQLGYCTV